MQMVSVGSDSTGQHGFRLRGDPDYTACSEDGPMPVCMHNTNHGEWRITAAQMEHTP